MMSDTELDNFIIHARNLITKLNAEKDATASPVLDVIYKSSGDTAETLLKNLEDIKRLRDEASKRKKLGKFDNFQDGQTGK